MGIVAFLYGAASYTAGLIALLYAIGFVGNVLVPKGIDSAPAGALPEALLVDALLVGLFAVQHSVMARPGFKAVWTRIVPRPAERSTYVLVSSLLLALLCWKWQAIPAVVWDVSSPALAAILLALFGLGWLIVLLSTFMINHFDLFGLRQVWLQLTGKPYQSLQFGTPALYRYVRHPLYVGWLLTFWAAPTMTIAHLVFALTSSAYILIAIRLEEHNLIAVHPQYQDYRRRVPMLLPFTKARP